ncbi:hypothetical protein IJE86_07860 [bacterium]|nr:hypothetical protein [bacterium]
MSNNKKRYTDYLKSPEWAKKRQHIAVLRKFTCEKCKKVIKTGFHIHHKTYKHFMNERDNELMFLCEDCHNRLHRIRNLKKCSKSKRKTITCKFCLNKISKDKYMKEALTHCPYCSSYIGRPTYYKKPF